MKKTLEEKATIYAASIERTSRPGGNLITIHVRHKGKTESVVIDERKNNNRIYADLEHFTSLHQINLANKLFRKQVKALWKFKTKDIQNN